MAALGTEHQQTIKAVKALVELYLGWHESEPKKGYDAKAVEWRAKLLEPDEEEGPTASGEGSGS